MAIKTLRVFQEFTSAGYVPMPVAGNIDYGVTIAGTFPGTTPTTFQTDDPDIDVTLTATTDYYVWIRSHGTDWNPMYTRNVRVYPDSPLVNNVVMGIIIANLDNTVPYVGATENVDLGTYGLKADYLQLNTSPTTTPATEGVFVWDSADGTANLRLKGGTINLQIGEDSVARVVNGTTSNLLRADYKVVKIIGAQGQRLQIGLALANNDANSKDTIGLVAENINNNQEGFIMTSGILDEINTTGSLQGETWLDGDTLYLSGTTAGKITNIKPQAPTHTIILGFVAYAHANHGKIYVKVDNGYELDELHNVKITSVANKNILVYETATSLWKNRNIFGTQGYVPYYDDTLLMKNSPIFTDGTQVIIGDDEEFSVGNKLSVVGNIAVHKDYGYHSGLYQILFRQDATGEFRIGTNAANDYTTFYANGTERVRISPSGFLGVGVSNPTSILHVKGTTAYTNAIIDNNSASGGGYYSAYQNGAEKAIFGVSGAWLLNNTSDAALIAKGVGQGIQFYTNGSTSEKMGINSDGNVFIGQTPTYVAGATQLVVRGKTGAGFVGVNHYDMSIKGFMNTFNYVFQVGTSTFHSMAFLVEDIERGRVNSSGRLLWGTTTDNTTDLVQINGSLIATSIKKSGGTSSQYLMADGSVSSGNSGTVTSVALSAPTGFSVSGSPVTSSGTLALSFASGYSLPSDATQATWTAKQNALNGTGFVKIVGTTISYDNSTYYLASNPSAYISGITSLMVTNALGYTPYNATNPSGYISGNQTITLSGDVSGSGATAITTTLATITQGATGSFVKITLDTKGRVTGNVAVGSSDITSALGYTPYNSTNPSGYISGITSLMVTNALGYTPYNSSNPAGYTTNVGTVTSVAMSVPTGLSISGSPITTSGTLALSLSAGYSIPTTSSQGTWDTAYNRSLTSIGVSGTTTKTLTLTKQDGTTLTASWSDINTDAVTSVFGRTGAIVATSGDYTTAQVTESGNLYYLDSRARASISGGTGISYNSTSGVITNTITQYTDALARASLSFVAGSGAYNSTTGVITIPTNNNQITNGAGYITGITSLMVTNALGYTPVTNARQLTINGTTYDLSADRSWTISGTIGGLTSGFIPKATSASTLGNSLIYDNGTNVGIGTTTPNQNLEVKGSSSGVLRLSSTSYSYNIFTNNSDGGFYIRDVNNTANRFIVSSTGNLGLGVTPSAWHSNFKALQIGVYAGLSDNSGGGGGYALFGNSYEYSVGAYKYLQNYYATLYRTYAGQHQWFNAASGTAGTAITWTQAMTLTNGGNLLVGTTTDAGYKLDVNGTGRFSGQLTASTTVGGTSAIFQNTGAQNANGIELRGGTGGTAVNWKIEKDNTVGNAFQLTPSTTNGGTTYTTPVLTIASTGAATFSGDLSVIKSGNALLRIQASTNTTPIADIELMRGTGTTWGADAYGDYRFRNSGGDLLIQYGDTGATSTRLTLASTGAATFSSSVTAGGRYIVSVSSSAGISDISYGSYSGGAFINTPSATIGYLAAAGTQALAWDSSNVIFYTNTGNERMRIVQSGNVGIGTTSPGATLDVAGALSNGRSIIRVTNTDTSNYVTVGAGIPGVTNSGMNFALDGTSRMVISSAGNVGIGTTSPLALLNVVASGTKSTIAIGNTAASTYSQVLMYGGSGKYNWSLGAQYNVNNGFEITPSTAVDGTTFTTPVFQITNTGAATFTGDVNIYKSGSDRVLYMSKSDGTTTIQLNTNGVSYITAGNVGIGTTSPAYKLEIYDAAGASMVVGAATGKGYFYADDAGATVGTLSAIPLRFATSATERMRITSGGNVGIGTTSPQAVRNTYLDISNTSGTNGVGLALSPSNTGLATIRFGNSAAVGYDFNFNDTTIGSGSFGIYSNSGTSYRLSITSGGNVLIGTTTDSGYKLDVNGTGIFRSSGTSTLRLKGNSTTGIDFQNDSGGGYIWNRDNTPIYFATNNTQRLVISETGAATFSSSVTATSFIKTGGTSSQYLMADGSVTTSSGGVGGSGTTNYISKWNGTTSLANSQIFDNGTQVTVGSNVAMYKFAVNPVSNSYFGIGFTGTNQIFVNAVDSGFTAVPIVNNALSHTWLIGFGDAMLLNNSGNLLLGTTTGISGGGKLQVNGDVNINGNFKINGTVIGGGGGSGITGSGTTNMIAKWTGGTALGDSALYDNGAYSMGIGTTSIAFPTDRKGLVIRPNGANSGEILLQNSGNTNGSTDGFAIANINGDGVALYNRINAHIRFGTNNTERLRITEDGNLGFGTTSQFGGGVKVIGIANSTTIPNTTPSGGGVLFVQSGALWYMGSSGTYTKIANA